MRKILQYRIYQRNIMTPDQLKSYSKLHTAWITVLGGQRSQYFFDRFNIVKFFAFFCKNGLISCNFSIFITVFNKNNSKFVIPVKNCVDWYITRETWTQTIILKFFVLGYPHDFFRENYFHLKYPNNMSLDSVFDGDYESGIIFMRICTKKKKIIKYERILAYSSRHFHICKANDCCMAD